MLEVAISNMCVIDSTDKCLRNHDDASCCSVARAAADDLAWAASLQSAPWPLPPARTQPPLKAQLLQLSGRLLRRAYRHPFLIA